MRTLYFFLIIVSLTACRSSKTNSQFELTHELLVGDWTMDPVESRNTPVVFSFGDTLCSYLYPFGPFTRYWVNGDTIGIESKEAHQENGKRADYHFQIHALDDNRIDLIPLAENSRALLREAGMEGTDTFHLQRIQPKNSITPIRITFYSSVCFGTCPSMYLDIDKDGKVRFYGLNFTDPEKGHTGQLTAQQHQWILRQAVQLPLKNLERWYRANWTDDQTACITLEYTTNKVQSCAYGFDEEPVELRILLHHLMELYKHIELKPADIQPEDFPHTDMMDVR